MRIVVLVVFVVLFVCHHDGFRIHLCRPSSRTITSTTQLSATAPPSPRKKDWRKKTKPVTDRTWKPIATQWRLFNVEVGLDQDPGKDSVLPHDALIDKVAKILGIKNSNGTSATTHGKEFINMESIKVIKKAFDGRWKKFGQPKFVYTVDIDLRKDTERVIRVRPVEGQIEPILIDDHAVSSIASLDTPVTSLSSSSSNSLSVGSQVVIVGAGPAGLFAAIALAEAGLRPIVVERGQTVEMRGRSIGALFNRKILDPESNLCYGEGGAGTWSDGKLTTRIGKNSDDVRTVLETLVTHGAPPRILVDGKPHLGTDRLVVILRNLRHRLIELGVEFRFGSSVVDFDIKQGAIAGVHLNDGTVLPADSVVLAVGHSARQLYERMVELGVHLEPKPIAVGFRVEHPQDLINSIQFGEFGLQCDHGKGKVPVADYRLTYEVPMESSSSDDDNNVDEEDKKVRACYSFCMCPGGQIVPTSVKLDELCLNGMSFSKRQSKWANSALVVSVTPEDYTRETGDTGPLRGVTWQRQMEQKAALMGGGNLVAPVQRLTDFMAGTVQGSAGGPISSSYRMGVKESPCHELYPSYITDTLRKAIVAFDRRMPGFLSPEGILHGVETRTSAPVQITRYADNFECTSISGLYPSGEGAGYAGGIISAAVDGMKVGRAIVDKHRRGGVSVVVSSESTNADRIQDRHSNVLY